MFSLIRRPLRALGAAALLAGAIVTAAGVLPASATTTASFTQVGGGYNPTLAGTHFAVRATECDRIANIHATGTIQFADVTTGHFLGSASLSGTGSPYVNCSLAYIADTENLSSGNYTIVARYVPGGTSPAPASPQASFVEVVQ